MNSPRKILVSCPFCEKRGEVLLPEKILQENKSTTTVFVRSGVTCNHVFHVFLDMNCKVRGYQRTDYEVSVLSIQANPPQDFPGQIHHDQTAPPVQAVISAAPDSLIIAAIRDFIVKIDGFISASTCAKGILELHNFIQSRRGFHPVFP